MGRFSGDASKGSIVTKTRLAEQVAAVEREIEAYSTALEANDAAEDQMPTPAQPSGEDMAEKVAALVKEQARMKANLARLEESGETQLSRTNRSPGCCRRGDRWLPAITCRSPSTTVTS